MIEKVLHPKNLYKAYRQVVANKGSAGIDRMGISEFSSQWEEIRDTIVRAILRDKYRPSPIRGVEIPKANGKTRTLGVPTVIDRWLQQAVSQQLASKFELGFEEESFGFRPQKSPQMAVRRSLKHIHDGYQDIVDIDLKGFFAAAAFRFVV
jgi:retron-type reverse transcriptase